MGGWIIAPAAPDVDGNPMIGNGPLKRLHAVGLGNATFAIKRRRVALFGDAGAPMSRLAQAPLMDCTTLTRSIRPLERAGPLGSPRLVVHNAVGGAFGNFLTPKLKVGDLS